MKRNNVKHLRLRTRNISCTPLKAMIVPKRTIYRMGSTTPTEAITRCTDYLEINSPESCKISGDKILMKQKFIENEIPTAEFITINQDEDFNSFKERLENALHDWKRIIIKHKHSSKGNGIYFIDSTESLNEWLTNNNPYNHIFEKYYTYSKEYRLHVDDQNGCFYTCRKMLKNDAEVRWHRHENNSVWILEDNPMFDKPNNWDSIVQDCVRAIKAVGLNIGAVDVKVQTHVENPRYIILETNSAPALGEVGIEKYKEALINYINNN